MRARLAALVGAAILIAGCGGDQTNPFDAPRSIAILKASSSIVFSSDVWNSQPDGRLEIHALDESGAGLTRLTRCNTEQRSCNNLEAAPAFDRKRLAIRRVETDTDGDRRLTAADGEVLVIGDVARGVEGEITLRVSTGVGFTVTDQLNGIDWSPREDILVYSARIQGAPDDLFRSVPRPDPSASETRNLTFSATVSERRPRIDPTGTVAVFERIDPLTGVGAVVVFQSSAQLIQVTTGGPAGRPLPGTPYTIGSDADPDYSPDAARAVFRRLTAPGADGRGTWDLYTVRVNGSELQPIATGGVHRGAPDWGPKGILFTEADPVSGGTLLVVVQSDGSGRRVVSSFAAGVTVQHPRWLP